MEKMESLSELAENKRKGVEKLSIMQTSLALVAANIGGGILGMPYAFHHLGVSMGIIICFTFAVLSHLSSILYLKTKDLTPRRYESVYEIAYLLVGRPSIFVVCGVLFAANMGAVVMYYIIIGDTLSALTTQALIPSEGLSAQELEVELSNFPPLTRMLCNRAFGICLVGIFQLKIIFKRQLEELKIVSYIFMALILLFIVLLLSEVGSDIDRISETVDYASVMHMKKDYHMITAFSILTFAYSI